MHRYVLVHFPGRKDAILQGTLLFCPAGFSRVMGSLSGKLLVSIPGLVDPSFFRSVVLLFRHDQEAATGLILNRQTTLLLSSVIDDLHEDDPDSGDSGAPISKHLFWGGPVTGPLMALHGSLALSESSVLGGVQFSVTRDSVKGIVTQQKHPFRIFSGYAGWGSGQLEAEIAAGGWLVVPASKEDVFCDDPGNLWHQVCEKAGRKIMLQPAQWESFGDGMDPRLN